MAEPSSSVKSVVIYTARELAEKFPLLAVTETEPTPTGPKYLGRCPAHPDSALKFWSHPETGIKFDCRLGCRPPAILKALGLTAANITPKPKEKVVSLPLKRDPVQAQEPAPGTLEVLLDEMVEGADPWGYANAILDRETPTNLRSPLYKRWIAMVAAGEFSPAERDMLVARGVKVFTGIRSDTMRADLKELRKANGEPDTSVVSIPDVELWDKPVTGAELADLMLRTVEQYMVLDRCNTAAGVLWCIYSHAYNCFDISPMLAITSPTMRCGKSRLLILLSLFVARRLLTSNTTGAAVYRVIQSHHPTLVADEVERFITDDKHEITGIFNAGHLRETAYVLRSVGDTHEPTNFSTWAPKMFALIGKLTATLMDRSIELRLQRRKRSEPVGKLRRRQRKELAELAIPRKIARWVADNLEALTAREETTEVPAELDDRAADNWLPLIAIADQLGGNWPAMAREAALVLSSGRDEEDSDSGNAKVLADVLAVFGDRATASTKNILSGLNLQVDYKVMNRGAGMTDAQLARALRGFGVKPRTIREGVKTSKGYIRKDFENAQARYLSPELRVVREPVA